MKNTKKMLLCCLCVIAVAAASVLGTLAYLTDTDSAVNTFTVGHVDIKLDEADVDENGTPIEGADRVQENEYHLIPGGTYTKDPTITVQPNSEESYVRMILTVHNASAVQAILTNHALGDFSALIGGWDPAQWLYHGFTADETANTISFEFRYQETVSAEEDEVPLPALFDTLIVPGEVTGEELAALYGEGDNGFKMVVTGHAIQAAGFDTEDAAWAAFDEQTKYPVFSQM